MRRNVLGIRLIGVDLAYVIMIVLNLIVQAISFRVEFLGVVFQEHVIFMNSDFDIFQVSEILVFKKLVLGETSLFHGHNKFFTVSYHIIRKVGPFKLRFIQHLLAICLFLL